MVLCPAKLNLFLAITALRPDGYHNLLSLMAPLSWGDRLHIEPAQADRFHVEGPFCAGIPLDSANLVLRALQLFRQETKWNFPVEIVLEKNVPCGSGLGAGSSDCAQTLVLLNALAGNPLSTRILEGLGSQLGSDVALFIKSCPQIVSARGEQLQGLDRAHLDALSQWHFMIIKPTFSISTPWAYAQLKSAPQRYYTDIAQAHLGLKKTLESLGTSKMDLYNTFEAPVFAKFPLFNLLKEELSVLGELSFALSGSGSACFVAYRDLGLSPWIQQKVEEICGKFTFCIDARVQNS